MKSSFDTVVLGAGPAGTGPLMCAFRRGDAARLLDRGVLWIDRGERMVAGTLGDHLIESDTASNVLLECLDGEHDGPLADLLDHPATAAVRAHGSGPLPLPVAGQFLGALGQAVEGIVAGHSGSGFLPRTTVCEVMRVERGYVVKTHSTRHGERIVEARRIVWALGGVQRRADLLGARLAGRLRLGHVPTDKVCTSSELFTAAGQASIFARLRERRGPRLLILGGSHSAVTSAWLALHRSGAAFEEGGVEMLCRRLPRLYYPDRAQAIADGYAGWDDDDVCPVTGRLFRFAGLRLHSRETVRNAFGLGGSTPDPRLSLDTFDPEQDEARVRAAIDRADIVVAAFGYAPRVVPVTHRGAALGLQSTGSRRAPLVDRQCRVLTRGGAPLPNVYGIGLASGFVPDGALGGEPSFRGQTNGLWLYQNGVGEIVLEALLRPVVEPDAEAEAGVQPRPRVSAIG